MHYKNYCYRKHVPIFFYRKLKIIESYVDNKKEKKKCVPIDEILFGLYCLTRKTRELQRCIKIKKTNTHSIHLKIDMLD